MPAVPSIPLCIASTDAIDLRVDLLQNPTGNSVTVVPNIPPLDVVAVQLSALSHMSPPPIVFMVHTAMQGGTFPTRLKKEVFALDNLTLHHRFEYVDVGILWSANEIQDIADYRVMTRLEWDHEVEWASGQGKMMGLVQVGAGGTARVVQIAWYQDGLPVQPDAGSGDRASQVIPDIGVMLLDSLASFPKASLTVAMSVILATGTTTMWDAGSISVYLLPMLFSTPSSVVVKRAYKPPVTPALPQGSMSLRCGQVQDALGRDEAAGSQAASVNFVPGDHQVPQPVLNINRFQESV
ncbi:3-dehydroquinate dehydratase (3-dehydroquinase) [Ceratobasidium sp. 370]|nr:3-dehydroquinate dehydratase (3-dehydroquinase) [Ceratobasidium sp. 370]